MRPPRGPVNRPTSGFRPADLVEDVLDEVFSVPVRDFSAFAVALYGKDSATADQQRGRSVPVRRPVVVSPAVPMPEPVRAACHVSGRRP